MGRIVYEDKNLRLEYVNEGNYIHETWWGITTNEVFYKLLNTIVDELNKADADGLILDAREHKGLGPEAQEVAAKTIGNYAKKHGKFKEAIIVPKDVFSRFSVENYAKKVKVDTPVDTRFFDNLEAAEAWHREI
jgi:hypothetical protein